MDVNAVGPVAGPSVRFSATEHAQRLALANESARLARPAQAEESAGESPNVTTSRSYSPALYAQAAHFQLLAQAGAFAALHSVQDRPAPRADTEAVAKVDSVSGSTVDNLH